MGLQFFITVLDEQERDPDLIHASTGPSLRLYSVTHGGPAKEPFLIKVLSSRRAN